MTAEDCGCGKPKPGPHGNPTTPPKSLVASVSASFTHVAPDGKRTPFGDLLGARAAAARHGGIVDVR